MIFFTSERLKMLKNRDSCSEFGIDLLLVQVHRAS